MQVLRIDVIVWEPMFKQSLGAEKASILGTLWSSLVEVKLGRLMGPDWRRSSGGCRRGRS
jgi:hypothetical protein